MDAGEIGKFASMADAWWDPEGPLRPLHLLNPVRLSWIRQQAVEHFRRDPACRRPFEGLRVLDVGCGGGLIAEPLARLGARVVGIDPARENIRRARERAGEQGLAIDYRVATGEDLRVRGEEFDLVLALEVIEHVEDPELFVAEVAELVRPGGMAILSTLSRNLRSFLLSILVAEHLLGWLPPGTHDWRRFVRPSELAAWLRRSGLKVRALTGLSFDAARQRFELQRDPSVNYMMAAIRAAGSGVQLGQPG